MAIHNMRYGIYAYRLPALLLLCIIGACATQPSTELPASGPWTARQQALSQLSDWTMSGRLSVTNASDGWHGTLRWVQQAPNYSIDLIGPLGQGRISIRGNDSGVSVRTADGKVLTATDPEQLLLEVSGLDIPLNGLLYWVRGLPEPNSRSVLAGDQRGRLTRMEQTGWVIDYLRYTPVANLEMPERIDARRADLQIKLAINRWNLET